MVSTGCTSTYYYYLFSCTCTWYKEDIFEKTTGKSFRSSFTTTLATLLLRILVLFCFCLGTCTSTTETSGTVINGSRKVPKIFRRHFKATDTIYSRAGDQPPITVCRSPCYPVPGCTCTRYATHPSLQHTTLTPTSHHITGTVIRRTNFLWTCTL
jgi:hypothetical protein